MSYRKFFVVLSVPTVAVIWLSLMPIAESGARTVRQIDVSSASNSVGGLAKASTLVGQKKYDQALIVLNKLKGNESKSAEYHYLLGVCYAAKGANNDYRQARKHLRIAIRLGRGSKYSQKANAEIMKVPTSFIKPRTGSPTRFLASLFGLSRDRGSKSAVPTVIDFYASWCKPCKQLEKDLGSVTSQYGDKIRVLRVDVDDPKNEKMVDQYEISPIPTVIFLNTDGEVVDYSIGYSGSNSLVKGIQKILTLAGS